jgi:hypothetical protein
MSVQYTNIYVKPFLSVDQRNYWTAFINNQSIFLPQYITNIESDIRLVVEYGIQQLNFEEYVSATANFYRKRLTFGNVKYAIEKDVDGNHTQDVVYIEIIDNIQGANPSISMNSKTYYPNSIDNIRIALQAIQVPEQGAIIVDSTQLPRFMQTVQKGNSNVSGYTTAIVLCYTTPNNGSKILSKIRKSKFDFKLLDFEVDRLAIESSLDNLDQTKYLLFPRKTITDIY